LNNNDQPKVTRRDFRAETAYPFWFRKLETNDGPKGDAAEWHRSYTLNLSAGGALVSSSNENLQQGDLIEFELVVPGGPVFGIAKVVRVVLDGQREEQYAFMFVSIAPRDKDRIAQVVLNDGLEKRYDESR